MFRKKKLTEIQQRTIQVSNCFNCGWRSPLNNNPISCVLGIRERYREDDCELCSNPHCDRWISDTNLEIHLKSLLHISEGVDKV
jgi:hypothetical protein